MHRLTRTLFGGIACVASLVLLRRCAPPQRAQSSGGGVSSDFVSAVETMSPEELRERITAIFLEADVDVSAADARGAQQCGPSHDSQQTATDTVGICRRATDSSTTASSKRSCAGSRRSWGSR